MGESTARPSYDPHCFSVWVRIRQANGFIVEGWSHENDDVEAIREQIAEWRAQGAELLELKLEGTPITLTDGLWL